MAAGQSDSQIPGAVPSKPGILFVLSTVLDPSTLAPMDFADWYENTHIQEVQSTGGISGSQRYEALTFAESYRGKKFDFSGKVPRNRNLDFDFATVYNMPDLAFRESEAFRGLDGQTAPREELLEGLFKRVSFITRFAEEVSSSGPGSSSSDPAPFVVTIAPSASGGGLPSLERIDGLIRIRRYEVHEGSLLKRFERSWLDEPKEMAILQLESEKGVLDISEIVGKAGQLEVGFWGLRRDYDGGERTPKGWSPRKV